MTDWIENILLFMTDALLQPKQHRQYKSSFWLWQSRIFNVLGITGVFLPRFMPIGLNDPPQIRHLYFGRPCHGPGVVRRCGNSRLIFTACMV